MNIHEIRDLSNHHVLQILRNGLESLSPLEENYSPELSNNPANLFYLLANGRYSDGCYYVAEEDGKYVASAGWNRYDKDTAIVLSRAYVSKPYRTTYIMGSFLLPRMLEQCKDYEKVWITCNDHNKTIYNWFVRSNEGKRPAMFSNWPEIYSNFEPIGKKTIYYTEQFVVQLKRQQ